MTLFIRRLGLVVAAVALALPLFAGAAAAQPNPERHKRSDARWETLRSVLTPEQLQKEDQARALHLEVMKSLTPEQRAKLKELRQAQRAAHAPRANQGQTPAQ